MQLRKLNDLPVGSLRVARERTPSRWVLFSKYFIRHPIRALRPPALESVSFWQRALYTATFIHVTRALKRKYDIHVPHKNTQVLSFVDAIHSIPAETKGCIVEAGCFKGASAAKFSHAAKRTGRTLYLFDSFEGLPENEERHEKSILGHSIEGWFQKGRYQGTLEEVRTTISMFGHLDVCRFIEGWFDDTLPGFNERIAAAYIDVDLASSTRTCIKHLYPLIVPGGVLISQDGDFPLVIDVFKDDAFWEKEVGCKRPHIEGLGTDKILKIVKPTS